MLQVGAKAPEFEGVLDDGTAFRLSEALGRGPVVLYFYPKDFTGGCTKEACSFRDNFGAIGAAGATLVGVSADNEDSHTRFRESTACRSRCSRTRRSGSSTPSTREDRFRTNVLTAEQTFSYACGHF